MDYEKKYKDLVEAVKKLQETNPSDDGIQKWVKDNVPELMESEDEKSKKWILEYLYDGLRKSDEQFKNQFKAAISWLKKQGKTVTSIKWHDVSEEPKKNRELLCEWSGSGDCTWHDAAFYNPHNKAFWNCGQQVKHVTKWCYIDELEKQDGQKETLCDKCRKEQPSGSCQDITALGRCALEKQGEQKPVDKVEPKFKVGDWCIDEEDGTIFQIIKVLNHTYTYRTNEGDEYSCTHYSLENDARHWTMLDAKDGDVLVTDFEEDNMIVMYHSMCTKDTINVHCCLNNKIICSNLGVFDAEDVKPATKEQRDLLFQKLKEAGYKWDAESKEVKKVEQIHVCRQI